MKSNSASNFVCFGFVIFCMIYAGVYSEILYYHPHSDFFAILYHYFTYQMLCFCMMKLLGSLLKKKSFLKIDRMKRKSYFVAGFFILYLGFVFLMEMSAFPKTVVFYTSVRYFLYTLFGLVGFLVGLWDAI